LSNVSRGTRQVSRHTNENSNGIGPRITNGNKPWPTCARDVKRNGPRRQPTVGKFSRKNKNGFQFVPQPGTETRKTRHVVFIIITRANERLVKSGNSRGLRTDTNLDVNKTTRRTISRVIFERVSRSLNDDDDDDDDVLRQSRRLYRPDRDGLPRTVAFRPHRKNKNGYAVRFISPTKSYVKYNDRPRCVNENKNNRLHTIVLCEIYRIWINSKHIHHGFSKSNCPISERSRDVYRPTIMVYGKLKIYKTKEC